MPATSACTTAGQLFERRKKRPVIANVAIARELAGWCWSLAIARRLAHDPQPLTSPAVTAGRGSAWSNPRSSL